MTLTPTPNHSSSSSSSNSQPLPPATQQLHPMLESQNNFLNSADNPSSSSLAPQRKKFPGAPFFINGSSSKTPHQDTVADGTKIARIDLNFAPSDMDVDGQDSIPQMMGLTDSKQLARAKKVEDTISPGRKSVGFDLNFAAPTEMEVDDQVIIPRRIRLTKLKQLARAKKVKLGNPEQEEWKNELKDDRAGSEKNLHDSSQQQLDAPCQSNSSSTVCRKRNRCPGGYRIFDSENGRTCHLKIYSWFTPTSFLFENVLIMGLTFSYPIPRIVSLYSAIKRQ